MMVFLYRISYSSWCDDYFNIYGDAPYVIDLIVSGPAGSALDASVDGCLEIVYDVRSYMAVVGV